MKSVVICGSQRYSDEISQFAARLRQLGVPIVFTPDFKNPRNGRSLLPERDRFASRTYRQQIPGFVHQHLDRIRRADICFVYNKKGYVGVNTTLEIGFAHGKEMIIYALEPEIHVEEGGEPCRHILFAEIISTPEELYRRLA